MCGSIVCLPIVPTPELTALAASLPDTVIRSMPESWHVTLVYIPDANQLTSAQLDALDAIGALLAGMHAPIALTLTSIHQFAEDRDGMAAVAALIDSPSCVALKQAVTLACAAAGIPTEGYPVFVPHITLGDAPIATIPDQVLAAPIILSAADLGLWVGAGRVSWPCTGTKARPRITGGVKHMPPLPAGVELKANPHFTKSITGRTVIGIFSVFGNTDSYSDIILPDSFRKTFAERGNQILHLWQHDCDEPPIAKVDALRELRRDELPPQILAQYPEATGGAEVTRTYLPTPRADEVLTNIVSGVPLQMSFMFDALAWKVDQLADGSYQRTISEIRLWETSDVNWGANSATMASKRLSGSGPMALAAALTTLDRALSEAKAGGRHSAADMKLLNAIHRQCVDLGCSTCAGDTGDADSAAKALILADTLHTLIGSDADLIAKIGLSPLAATLRSLAVDSEIRTDAVGRAADPARTPDPEPLISPAVYQYRLKAAQAALALASRRSIGV